MTRALLSLLLAAPASASIIYATSYNDHSLNTLNFNGSSLSVVSKQYDCGSEPTWLTLDYAKSIMYCMDEGWGGKSSLTAYQTSASGNLTKLSSLAIPKSPVAATLFGPRDSQLAIAFYDTSTFGTFNVADPKALTLVQNETYSMAQVGPNAERQDVPHLHDAVLDPTKNFIIVPDLGADLVRVYQIKQGGNGSFTPLTPIKSPAGSGPRHAAFAVVGSKTYLYILNELGNSITGYSVMYMNGSAPMFTQLFMVSDKGPSATAVPKGTKAAEIIVSPDNRFAIISSRLESSLMIPNFDMGNTTMLPSDPLVTFSIDQQSGNLTHVQTAPAGGRDPRGFTLNKAGNLLVSALQDDNRVVVIERNVQTGMLGKILAHATVGVGDNNGPSYAFFYE